MNSKTKKITTLVVSTVAVIATVVILLIGAPAYSTGETVETTNSVATTTETMTTQTMTETITSTAEITTATTETTTTVETTTETIEVVTTKQTTTFIVETQTPTTEAVLVTTETLVTNETKETTVTENVETNVVKKTNEEIAEEVINGLWGNGQDRKKKLTEYGYDYNSIQKIVDELMRNNFNNQDDKNTPMGNYIGKMRITGYVATGNRTASGVYPYVGGVAMNNAQRKELGIKWGDKIYIDGLGTYVVFDCGCKRNVVDVFCNTVPECYALTSYADVYIIK